MNACCRKPAAYPRVAPGEWVLPRMRTLRQDHRYTAYFCEENIWWLASSLVGRGVDPSQLSVLLFSNPDQHVLMAKQRAAPAGELLAWDYHVVLEVRADTGREILDFDTRLGFSTPWASYFRHSFLPQEQIPELYRAWVRPIAAGDYLRHFYSDRSHMIGKLGVQAFPDYPIIQPAPGVAAIDLATYRETTSVPLDRSRMRLLAEYLQD